MRDQIHKIYLSNFLTGLVFWYGIEKLFMRSIGIDAVGIGLATAVFLVIHLVLDIPFGILADKWSRKGVLIFSAVALGVSSAILGASHSLLMYAVGEVFYGLYIVSTIGTYNAVIYDLLHEDKKTAEYSKVSGRAYALFLGGAGVANVGSGFLAQHQGYRFTYFITIISCVLNALVLLTLREPKFHKAENKERMLRQLKTATVAIGKIKLLRALTVVMALLSAVDIFQSEFGQLYAGRYFSSAEIIGLFWAMFAFAWSFGSLIAHRLRARLHILVVLSAVPFVAMSFIDNWFSLVLFVVQVVAGAALYNQVETRIQENTPSAVRASILSVVSSLGTALSVPVGFLFGWAFRDYNGLFAVRVVAVIAVAMLLFWLLASRGVPHANDPTVAETVPEL